MKNYITLTLALLAAIGAGAQIKVTQGDNSQPFKITKQPNFTSYASENSNYFVLNRTEHFVKINTLVIADKAGNINTATDIILSRSIFSDAEVNKLLVVGNSIVAFIENRDKKAGKNTLVARLVDEKGNIGNSESAIGSIDFVKMSNAGKWHVALTADQKHVAVVGQLPHEKNAPDQFEYHLLDANLKETAKGKFSFAGYTKEISVWNFLASDKGDLYLISEEFDKSYKFPVVYQYTAASNSANIIPVIIGDAALRMLSYTTSVNPQGELIIAGYSQQKKTFVVDDVPAVGTWYYNSSKPQEVKTFAFDKPVTSLTARNIVYNGDTFFLVGEQYKAEKDPQTSTNALTMEDNFHYDHGDIMVTGFSNDGVKKFDITVSRNKWSARNSDGEFMVASGVINNKLALVFNDQYGKYIDDRYYKSLKLPVAVSINNNGLMEAPVHFEKELDVKVSSYTLMPLFFSASNGRVVVLSTNSQSVKTVTFH